MPHVAMVAAGLFVLWLFVNDSRIYQESLIGPLFGFITFIVVSLTIIYFGLTALRWLKNRLLWRVRRRLMITYLFVGLTPIILVSLLGFIITFSGSNRAMSRVIAAQINATEQEALTNARHLVEALKSLPPNASDRTIQTWLDERIALLHTSLPGARVALWRSDDKDASMLGHREAAKFVSILHDEKTRGVGHDTTPLEAPLPEWLSNHTEWSGLAYIPAPAGSIETFATPSVRAVVRGKAHGRALVLLLVIPVSRALVQHLHDNTGISLYPFFIDNSRLAFNRSRRGRVRSGEASEPDIRIDHSKDQFGEPINWQRFPVYLTAANWTNGVQRPQLAFFLTWSWDQLLGGELLSQEGQAWQRILLIIGTLLLIVELSALFAAAWMTRAVTGTVHKLYRATESIKRGDFSHRVRVRSRDQLGELAEAFNAMSANIESLLQERVERERLQREVEIAAEVQAQLFPREVPHLEATEIAGECRAARGVAGDYYDYVEIVPGVVIVVLGDVSGKGISASLVMSNLQAALRAQATIMTGRLRIDKRVATATIGEERSTVLPCGVTEIDNNCAVENIVASINEQLCRSTDLNRFATLFLALYDDRTRMLRYTNAGHNAAILVRADGSTERLTAGGTVVGAFDWARYEEAHTTLETSDLLLIFSDGLSEAQNSLGEEYGEIRLAQFVAEHGNLSADEMRRAIFDEIDNWSGPQERGDDQTLVIMKVWSLESKYIAHL